VPIIWSEMKKFPPYLKYMLNIGISIGILAILFVKIPVYQTIGVMKNVRFDLFFLSVLVGVLSIILNTLRWQVLLKCLGYHYNLRSLSKLSFMTLFLNTYLPGGIAGDLARTIILPQQNITCEARHIHVTKIAASVVTDRIAGFIGLMLLAMAGFIFSFRMLSSKVLFTFFLNTLSITGISFFLFSRTVQRFLKKIFILPLSIFAYVKTALSNITESLALYHTNLSLMRRVVILSIISNLCVVIYSYFLAQSIGLSIDFFKLLAFIPIIEFVSSLPVSFGGVGIRETVTVVLFSSEGISAVKAMSVSLLSFMVILLLGMIGGIYFLSWNIQKKQSMI
jgi:uncharacterized protein (TIRG00374 family)